MGSALADGRTYILYSVPGIPVQPAVISIGVEVTARLESVSVENLNVNDVRVAKLNIVDATLLELYREKAGKSSLNGHVLLQPVPAISRAAAPEDDVNKTADSVSKLTVKGWM